MTFMSYELMVNVEVQRKLQKEIDEMNELVDGKKVNYEQIQGMKYMDQVVCETLRKWPPAPAVDRYDNIRPLRKSAIMFSVNFVALTDFV